MLILVLALAGCGGAPSSADTGIESGREQPAGIETGSTEWAGEARHQVNKEYQVTSLKIKIGKIVIQKDRVIVGMTVSNPGKDTISFYPDMEGAVIIGNMQLDVNPFFTEGEVGGEIHNGVDKEGVLHFLAPEGKQLKPEEVKEIKLNLGEIINQKDYDIKEFNETIKLGG